MKSNRSPDLSSGEKLVWSVAFCLARQSNKHSELVISAASVAFEAVEDLRALGDVEFSEHDYGIKSMLHGDLCRFRM